VGGIDLADPDDKEKIDNLVEQLKRVCHADEVQVYEITGPKKYERKLEVYKNVLVYPESHGGHLIYIIDEGKLLHSEMVLKIIFSDASKLFWLKLLGTFNKERETEFDPSMVG